jgi:hypothetical protein
MDIVFKVRKTKQFQYFFNPFACILLWKYSHYKDDFYPKGLFEGLDMLQIAALGLMQRVTLTDKNYIQNYWVIL